MKNLVRNLAYRQSHGDLDIQRLSDIIEKGYESYKVDEFMQKETFSPSTVGYGHGRCPRYWYIAFNGAIFQKDADPKSMANMLNGTMAHERIAELFERSGLDIVEVEQELITENPPVRGFIDVIVDRAGEGVVGEFKTTRNVIFMHRRANMRPAGYHIIQVLLYLWGTDLEMGFVLYENKDSHEVLIIPVKRSDYEDELEELLRWMRMVYSKYEDDILPKRPYKSKRSKVCKRCPVREACWEGLEEGEEEVETLSVLPK